MSDPIRVLIVDDHRAFAESLHSLLARQDGLEVCGSATTVADGVQLAVERRPRVVLMDQRFPDATGAEATARILAACNGTVVVMLSGGTTEDELLAAVQAGICGYLEKTAGVAEIVEAIRRAASGEMLLPPAMLTRLLRRSAQRAARNDEAHRHAGALAPREREALALMAQGLDTKSIAARLGISVNTARGYVQRVIEVLGAHSRLEAVLRAQELGILRR